jgi:riboflavin biosynthesis pyrimidine reductase
LTRATSVAGSVEERILQIWNDPLQAPAGTLQVVAVASRANSSLGVMRITPQTPASPTDQFSLEIARARADVILTSGSILRSEPRLRHGISEATGRWRQEVLGKKSPPEIIFLSRGPGLPLSHPAIRQPGAVVATSSTATAACRKELQQRGVRHREIPEDSPQELVRELLAEGVGTITLEIGPSTAAAFYNHAPRVGELMLSWCEDFELPESLDAGDFASWETLQRILGAPRHETRIEEPAHCWRFSHWRTKG